MLPAATTTATAAVPLKNGGAARSLCASDRFHDRWPMGYEITLRKLVLNPSI
jgi:hypothetical protein